MLKTDELLYSLSDNGVMTVTLNRPKFMNALTWDMEKGLAELFEYCSYEDSVRVVVLTGAGKHFCAGGDILKFKERIDSGEQLPKTGVRYVAKAAREIRRCNKPVIAKINGAAVGAGSALAFACDFRVMGEKSRLSAGFTSMGFSGDTNGWYNLSRMIGMSRTTQFYMLAETFDAKTAFELGIANKISPDDELDSVTDELADKLANSPTSALSYQKKMFNLIAYKDLELLAELEENYMPACSSTHDHAEAVNAFLEKRAPKFNGK